MDDILMLAAAALMAVAVVLLIILLARQSRLMQEQRQAQGKAVFPDLMPEKDHRQHTPLRPTQSRQRQQRGVPDTPPAADGPVLVGCKGGKGRQIDTHKIPREQFMRRKELSKGKGDLPTALSEQE